MACCRAKACLRQTAAVSAAPRALGDGREAQQRGVQEPAEPNAFAAPRDADPIHAVVPIAGAEQRQAVRADCKTRIERAHAMLEQRRGRPQAPERREVFQTARGQADHPPRRAPARRARRNPAGDFQIVGNDECQPNAVVRDARLIPWPEVGSHQCCTSPASNWRAGGSQYVFASDRRPRNHERHDILQLIAKAVGAARLIERRPPPDAAASV